MCISAGASVPGTFWNINSFLLIAIFCTSELENAISNDGTGMSPT